MLAPKCRITRKAANASGDRHGYAYEQVKSRSSDNFLKVKNNFLNKSK